MHPILLFEPSLAMKVVVAAVTIAGLILFIRNWRRNGKL